MIPVIRFYGEPYQTLGFGPDATEKEIRKAYRRPAMQYHPDRNPDNPEAGAENAKSEEKGIKHYRPVRDEIKSFVAQLPEALREDEKET